MKRLLFVLMGLLLLAAPTYAETEQEGNVFFPVAEPSYQGNPVLSLLGGSYFDKGLSASVLGLELSLDCPMLQVSAGNIRQQISVSSASFKDATTTLIELNPHWMTEVAQGLTVGFGPGLGWAQTSVTGGEKSSKFALGLGVSAAYQMDALQLGAEFRSMNGSRAVVKLGFAF